MISTLRLAILSVKRDYDVLSDSPGKRLASFRKSVGQSQRAFSTSMGVSAGLIGQIETDGYAPSRTFLQRISDIYGVSADWLLNGHGEMIRAAGSGFSGRLLKIEPPDYTRPGHGDLRFDDVEYAFAKRMNISVSAGKGLVPVEGSEFEHIALPIAWYERHRLNSDFAVLVTVKGDSMAPSIPDGALVLVHASENQISKPGIYAFTRDGEAFVKRLQPSNITSDGRPRVVILSSDNPAYPPVVLTGSEMNDLRIVGRVRAVFTTIA